MTESCDRCDREIDDDWQMNVSLVDNWTVCPPCGERLDEFVEKYDWKDRYTEEQHERAVDLFSEREEIQCVISDYDAGQIVIHTPYVSSDVVGDFIDHFAFRIVAFHPVWENEGKWPCMNKHGSTFQIVLAYTHRCGMPAPTNTVFEPHHIENLDGNDKQF